MTHSLVLEVPESIYQPFVEEARAEGRKVEEIALQSLADGKLKPAADTLEQFVQMKDKEAKNLLILILDLSSDLKWKLLKIYRI